VFFAAWLGWGFDIFDGLLFNFVAPNAIPTLLGLEIGGPEARAAVPYWNGILNSILLLGWAAGGVIFGPLSDRFGRKRVLMITMLLYALGTASCAFVTDMWQLIIFRIVASLGIGGEWAAGASMVAETVPESRRVEAGALLYTAAPLGLFLATFVNHQIAGVWFAASPETSWRIVFLFGLVPAAVAFAVRMFVREPERWQQVKEHRQRASMRDLFAPGALGITVRGTLMAVIALIAWWSANAFIPTVTTGLAQLTAQAQGFDRSATLALVESWKAQSTLWFNLGGLAGTLITIPIAKQLGRKPMFALYFALSALSIFVTFGLDWTPAGRNPMYYVNIMT
jgi:MFS family permease